MTTKTATPTIAKQIAARREEIVKHIDEIDFIVSRDYSAPGMDYGHAGDLAHVAGLLKQAADFLARRNS